MNRYLKLKVNNIFFKFDLILITFLIKKYKVSFINFF